METPSAHGDVLPAACVGPALNNPLVGPTQGLLANASQPAEQAAGPVMAPFELRKCSVLGAAGKPEAEAAKELGVGGEEEKGQGEAEMAGEGAVAQKRGSMAPAGHRRVQLLHPDHHAQANLADPMPAAPGSAEPFVERHVADDPMVDASKPQGESEEGPPGATAGPGAEAAEESGKGMADVEERDAAKGKALAAAEPVCAFCQRSSITKVSGKFVTVDKQGRVVRASAKSSAAAAGQKAGTITAHIKCMEWAPEVFFKGNSRICNVAKEVQRARLLMCAACGRKGAALGCFVPKCKRSYHYECARGTPGCAFNQEQFVMCCPDHASVCPPSDQPEGEGEEEEEDGEDVEEGDDAAAEDPAEEVPPGSAAAGISGGAKGTHHGHARLNAGRATGASSAQAGAQGCSHASLGDAEQRALHAAANTAEWPARDKSALWVLCASGLSATGKEAVKRFSAHVGAKVVEEWDPSVTHLIMNPRPAALSQGKDADGAAEKRRAGATVKRTLKYLMAVLHGQWVVEIDWIRACLAAGQHLDEEAYEVQEDAHGARDGPRRGRLSRKDKSKPIFAGLSATFSGPFTVPSAQDLQALFTAGGGTVLPALPSSEAGPRCPTSQPGPSPSPSPRVPLGELNANANTEPPAGSAVSLGPAPKGESGASAEAGSRTGDGGPVLVVFSDIPANASQYNRAEQHAREQREQAAIALGEQVLRDLVRRGREGGGGDGKDAASAKPRPKVAVVPHLWILDSAAACQLCRPIKGVAQS